MASRMRTGLCLGSVWNAALTRSRSFESMPPYIVSSRSPPVSPSAASTPCSQFCVARYSVKMMTRSFDHFPPGRMCSFSQPDQPLGLGVELGHGTFRPGLHLLEQRQLLGDRFPEQQAGRVDGLVGRLFGLVVDRVFLLHAVDLPLKDAARGLRDGLALPGGLAATISCCSSVRRKAAGLEKSRFLSVISTNRWRTLSAWSWHSWPAAARSTASERRGCAVPRPGNRLRGPRAPASGIGPGRSRPWAAPT